MRQISGVKAFILKKLLNNPSYSRDLLIRELWGEEPTRLLAKRFAVNLTHLRRLLEEENIPISYRAGYYFIPLDKREKAQAFINEKYEMKVIYQRRSQDEKL